MVVASNRGLSLELVQVHGVVLTLSLVCSTSKGVGRQDLVVVWVEEGGPGPGPGVPT